jgi:hypothetical protein
MGVGQRIAQKKRGGRKGAFHKSPSVNPAMIHIVAG